MNNFWCSKFKHINCILSGQIYLFYFLLTVITYVYYNKYLMARLLLYSKTSIKALNLNLGRRLL